MTDGGKLGDTPLDTPWMAESHRLALGVKGYLKGLDAVEWIADFVNGVAWAVCDLFDRRRLH